MNLQQQEHLSQRRTERKRPPRQVALRRFSVTTGNASRVTPSIPKCKESWRQRLTVPKRFDTASVTCGWYDSMDMNAATKGLMPICSDFIYRSLNSWSFQPNGVYLPSPSRLLVSRVYPAATEHLFVWRLMALYQESSLVCLRHSENMPCYRVLRSWVTKRDPTNSNASAQQQ